MERKGAKQRRRPASNGKAAGNGAVTRVEPPGAASTTATDRWREYLSRHHLKRSLTREEVVTAFLEVPGHIALAELHARVRKRNPSIGLATVYRALKLMEDAGIVEVRRFADRGASYEVIVGREHHDHLICERCNRVLEFSDPDIERIQEETAQVHGFVLVRHRHELFGLCEACQSGRRRA